MKSLLDEISRMKIKSALNGFKEWREGTVQMTFLKEIPSSTFESVGGGGGNSHITRKIFAAVVNNVVNNE